MLRFRGARSQLEAQHEMVPPPPPPAKKTNGKKRTAAALAAATLKRKARSTGLPEDEGRPSTKKKKLRLQHFFL